MMKYHKKYNKGFTLVEALVAVSIFAGSLLGLISISSKGVADTNYAKKKVIASYLAQEGIEYINNLRYTHVLYASSTQAGWDAFKANLTDASACHTVFGCYIVGDNLQYTNNAQPMIFAPIIACSNLNIQCNGTANGRLYYNTALGQPTTGKYNNSLLGSDSGFSRKIRIVVVSADEVKVTSTVYWLRQGSTSSYYSVSSTESIFNWNE